MSEAPDLEIDWTLLPEGWQAMPWRLHLLRDDLSDEARASIIRAQVAIGIIAPGEAPSALRRAERYESGHIRRFYERLDAYTARQRERAEAWREGGRGGLERWEALHGSDAEWAATWDGRDG